jgi:hypothetical protein
MSAYNPPTEFPIIFDSNLFPKTAVTAGTGSQSNSNTSSSTYLQYPTAQGLETFNNGVSSTAYNLKNGGTLGKITTFALPTRTFNLNTTNDLFTTFSNVTFPNAGTFIIFARYNLTWTSGASGMNSATFYLSNQAGTTVYAGTNLTGSNYLGNTLYFDFTYLRVGSITDVFIPYLQLGYNQSASNYIGSGEISILQIG